jgi:hypothetical protein
MVTQRVDVPEGYPVGEQWILATDHHGFREGGIRDDTSLLQA